MLLTLLAAGAAHAAPVGIGGTSVSLGASTPVAATVQQGALDVPILQVSLKRDAVSTQPGTLTDLAFDRLGNMAAAHWNRVRLWHDVNGDGMLDAGDTLLAEVSSPQFPHKFVSVGAPVIAPGATAHVLLTADLAPNAPVGAIFGLVTCRAVQPELVLAVQPGVTQLLPYGAESAIFTVGPALAPAFSLYDGALNVAHGAAAAGGRAFGQADVLQPPPPACVLEIRNGGPGYLHVHGVSISGANAADFGLDTGTLASVVAPGAATSFGVYFAPAMVGAKAATVEITHNDPALPSPFVFAVTGDGVSSNPPQLVVTTLPDGLAGQSYAVVTLTAGGGTGALAFAATGLPQGMSLSPQGELGGVPAQPGQYTLNVVVTDTVGASDSASLALNVQIPPVGPYQATPRNAVSGCVSGMGASPLLAVLLVLVAARARSRKIRQPLGLRRTI
jgi:hypothetical protein